ncbi:MAG: GTP-binding protein [Pararobbsia sp.]
MLSRKLDGHRHSGLAPHTHGLLSHKHFHEHDPGWQSFVLHSPAPQHEATLLAALGEIARTQPVMRIKGFVQTAGDARPLLIQGVRTRIGAVRSAGDSDVSDHSDSPAAPGGSGHSPTHHGDHDHEHPHAHGTDHDHEHGREESEDGHAHATPHHHDARHRHAPAPTDSQLVFIGYHATRKRIAELLTQSTSTEWH